MTEITVPPQTKQLHLLRDEIAKSVHRPWLFPTRGAVQGFMGTDPIMFVGERPSTGSFKGPAILLYTLLEDLGMSNSHLTDVIKSRGKVGEPFPSDISIHRRIFDREIDILRPRRIVAFGQKVYDLLQFALAGSDIVLRQVWHYSYLRRRPDRKDEFARQLKSSIKL